MAGITQKNSIAAFPLWSPQKQNGRAQKSENDMKNIWGFLLHTGVFIYNEELKIKQERYHFQLK